MCSTSSHHPVKALGIHQADLWGSRDHKYGWLQTHSISTTPWRTLHPALPQLLLTPRDETDAAEYALGWKVTDIYPVNSVGIVTARDSLTIHFTRELLKNTIQRFAKLSEEEARERFKLLIAHSIRALPTILANPEVFSVCHVGG